MKIKIQVIGDDGNHYGGEFILSLMTSKIPKKDIYVSAPRIGKAKDRKVTCASVIEKLWEQGEFRVAKSLSETNAAMDKMGGYSFPTNTLSMALERSSFLTRQGSRGNYVWKQKFPFEQ